MLYTLFDKQIKTVPHGAAFSAAKKALGPIHTKEVQDELDAVIDGIIPDKKTGKRTFNSSFLGSELSPWQLPILHLYLIARRLERSGASEKEVQDKAAMLFGQFVWERIIAKAEDWAFYDPNIGSRDPNHEITGKVYFERD